MNRAARNLTLPSRFRRISLYSFIAFLTLSALLAIATVLGGGFGSFELKVLVTTTIVATASICALCCSAHAQRSGIAWPGIAGAALALVSALLFIYGAWTETDSEAYWQTTIPLGIFSIATAHALALLGLRLRPAHAWLKPVTGLTLFTLAAVISSLVVDGSHADGRWKLIIVLSIVVVLETLVLPLLTRLTGAASETPVETLLLTKRAEGIYADERGCLYEIRAVAANTTEVKSCRNDH